MKKIKFLFLFVFALLLSHNAFALNCKSGQSLNSDECWTEVKVSAQETGVVSAGSVLVYDTGTDSAERAAYEVRLATASLDSFRIAGVAQTRIATGDTALVMVRGKGKICLAGTVASYDRLYTSASAGLSGTTFGASTAAITSGDPIGYALQASTGTRATIDAYITIV